VIQPSAFCRHIPLCCFSTSVYCCKDVFRYRLSPETFDYTDVGGKGWRNITYFANSNTVDIFMEGKYGSSRWTTVKNAPKIYL
jgi:hypothetical protein